MTRIVRNITIKQENLVKLLRKRRLRRKEITLQGRFSISFNLSGRQLENHFQTYVKTAMGS